jgi:hypothetical protein
MTNNCHICNRSLDTAGKCWACTNSIKLTAPLDKPFETNESIPPFTIRFHNGEDEIGMFDFSQSPATFRGDVDESARLFVEAVITQFGWFPPKNKDQ